MKEIARSIARALLTLGAVSLRPDDPFTWASGMKSPIYCDNRLTLSFPDVRSRITEGLLEIVQDNRLTPNVVAGVATAGIPQATLLADRLALPLVYVRSKAKGHGRQNLIEGRIEPGSRALVIEDLISTGGSSLQAVEALREQNVQIVGMLSIFSYGFTRAKEAFYESNIPFISLSDLDTLLEVARDESALTPNQIGTIRDWQRDPFAWHSARI